MEETLEERISDGTRSILRVGVEVEVEVELVKDGSKRLEVGVT